MALFCQATPCGAEDDRLFGAGGHVQLMSDRSVAELMNYAVFLGLKRWWVQSHPVPHFNIGGGVLERVIADPRVEKLDRPKFVEKYQLAERRLASN